MKLVLLPGLHGTGQLFSGLIQHLDLPTEVLELPATVAQDVKEIALTIESQLPDTPFVLLAESFSGGLIPNILLHTKKPIKGLIFVASFINCPHKLFTNSYRFLPKALLNATTVSIALKFLFLNGVKNKQLLNRCVETVLDIPFEVLLSRVKLMTALRPVVGTRNYLATTYLRANSDRVVGKKHCQDIKNVYSAKVYTIEGPHFILQANPIDSALAINSSLKYIMSSNAEPSES